MITASKAHFSIHMCIRLCLCNMLDTSTSRVKVNIVISCDTFSMNVSWIVSWNCIHLL